MLYHCYAMLMYWYTSLHDLLKISATWWIWLDIVFFFCSILKLVVVWMQRWITKNGWWKTSINSDWIQTTLNILHILLSFPYTWGKCHLLAMSFTSKNLLCHVKYLELLYGKPMRGSKWSAEYLYFLCIICCSSFMVLFESVFYCKCSSSKWHTVKHCLNQSLKLVTWVLSEKNVLGYS